MYLNNISLLFIEDQKETQSIVSKILKREVKELYIANNGQEGLDLYLEKKPDIVLTDIKMPILNGLELTKKIKEYNPNQPVVILTAFSDFNTLKESIDLGVERYILKPIVDIEKLLEPLNQISENIYYKKELIEATKRYEIFFKSNKAISLIVDSKDGKIVDCNEKATKFYGYDYNNLKKMNIQDINILSKDEVRKEMQNAKNENKDYFNFKHKLSSGEIRDVEVYSGPFKTKNKDYLYSIIFDVTEKMKNEVVLKQAMTVFENTHDGIIVTNKDVKIINVNPAFEKISGYKKEEVLNLNPNILKSGEHDDSFYKDIWDTLNKKGSWSGEILNKSKLGKIFYELLTINVIKNDEGEVINYIGVFSDTSIQKQQEKTLLQQSRTAALGEMISNIAHQWRQPLSAISAAATGLKLLIELKKEEFDEKELSNTLDLINKQTQYLSKTIDDFRDFFKDNSIKKDEFNLKDCFIKIENLTKDSYKSNFIEVFKDIDDEILLYENENLLVQAMINIFNNAKDAFVERSIPQRYFFIKVRKQKDIEIFLKDNAGGIEESFIEKIFEPYMSTKHSSVGTGLGLYMTYKIIVKQFGGKISAKNVEYEYNNEKHLGVEFKITIPLI